MQIYAILKNDIMVDAWCADSIEEAQADNPNAVVIPILVSNSPWHFEKNYSERIKEWKNTSQS
jgi:hypothetical protein